jgi:hypothetical protein
MTNSVKKHGPMGMKSSIPGAAGMFYRSIVYNHLSSNQRGGIAKSLQMAREVQPFKTLEGWTGSAFKIFFGLIFRRGEFHKCANRKVFH